WHFLTEGIEKYESRRHGKEPFSAEVYLRNAAGPLAPYFRGMLPDVDSRAMFDESQLKAAWREGIDWLATRPGLNNEQRSQAAKLEDEADRWIQRWFSDPENAEKRKKYFDELDKVQRTESDPNALSFELERAWEARPTLEADRRGLIAPLVERG